VKFALFDARSERESPAALARGELGGIGHTPHLSVCDATGVVVAEQSPAGVRTHEDAVAEILRVVEGLVPDAHLVAAGHRVVHGGERFVEPVLVTPEIRAALEELTPLAPLHQAHSLAAIDAVARLHPALPQVACFDTAFHAGQAWEATTFALPREFSDHGVRRYGFHGLSYEYIASRLEEHLGEQARGRVVVAHLGSGASMCAMRDRRSVATTMGFSALEGLPMGTRCGALDPGVILYLLERGHTRESIAELLWSRSGLLGLSGISDDVRELQASDDARAAQALSFFAYRVARELGSLAAALGGLDALIFTAGIGEHAPAMRARICERAQWLGVSLDPLANEASALRISDASSRVAVLVVAADEESMLARHVLSVCGRMLPPFHG
jgi:acetate kinase